MRNKFLFLLAVIVLGLAGSYAIQQRYLTQKDVWLSTDGANKLRIVTSFYPLYFFTKQIVGDEAVVYNVTPAGAEPHEYELTPRDAAQIQSSQLVIVNGGVEPWIDKIKVDLAEKNIPLVTAGQDLITREGKDEDSQLIRDPHVWLSPKLAQQLVAHIASAVQQVDPAHASLYAERASALTARLIQLDAEFTQGFQACDQKSFITSHAAFGYLAGEYGFTQIGISGLTPDDEPSPKDLIDIVNFAKTNKVTYIFFESLVNPKLSQTVAHEIGAKTLVLNPLEGLTDQEAAQGQDYFTVMRQNLANLQLALLCHTSTETP